MNTSRRRRALAGVLATVATGLLAAAGPAAADPIASSGAGAVAAGVPGRRGDRAQDQGPDDRAAEPVHGAQPVQQHPQRHLDDRRLPAQGSARASRRSRPRRRSRCGSAAASRSTAAAGSSPSARRCSPARRSGSWIRTPWRRSARCDLPDAANPPGTKPYQNFTGGGYFFLDQKDRIWVPTKTDHIFVYNEGADGVTPTLERDYDLTSVLDTSTERISSALPDFNGLVWFVSKANGKVGTLNTKTGALKVKTMNEEIENSFAVGEDGVYIVSDKRMYRFKATENGHARGSSGRRPTRTRGSSSRARSTPASGTTPTIMDNGYVAITDNADPMNVVVYRTAKKLARARSAWSARCRCSPGASATENSLLTAGRSLIVENNYGYQDPLGPTAGAVTEPGLRPRRRQQGRQGLHEEVDEHRGPRADRGPEALDQDRPDLHLRAGPLTRAAPRATTGPRSTGATARPRSASTPAPGLNYNNNYAGLALGPDGTAYLGVIGGMLALRDAS